MVMNVLKSLMQEFSTEDGMVEKSVLIILVIIIVVSVLLAFIKSFFFSDTPWHVSLIFLVIIILVSFTITIIYEIIASIIADIFHYLIEKLRKR